MKLKKDEARILAAALNDYKYKLNEVHTIKNFFINLENLENKLEEFSKDKRRTGRSSQDDWYDLVKRFTCLLN